MEKMKLKNVENVEGEFHLMFFEGKNIIAKSKSDIGFACIAALFFVAVVAIFVLVSGLNFYYLYFLAAFLIVFVVAMGSYLHQKHVGKKQCLKAIRLSNPSDIVAKETDMKTKSKVIVKSMSSTIDKYDSKEKFPSLGKKIKRQVKHRNIANSIEDFDK